ncbi:MAG TPA: hypothetical protein VE823_12060, partial [Geodermatophilus sp.]|nr:hypothetical protein [Geodermatophilus sp.]
DAAEAGRRHAPERYRDELVAAVAGPDAAPATPLTTASWSPTVTGPADRGPGHDHGRVTGPLRVMTVSHEN